MHFMKTGEVAELPAAKAMVFHLYQTEYRPFVRPLHNDPRKTDRALFSFGQFLKAAARYLPSEA
jgi:hypothetical protein